MTRSGRPKPSGIAREVRHPTGVPPEAVQVAVGSPAGNRRAAFSGPAGAVLEGGSARAASPAASDLRQLAPVDDARTAGQ